MRYSKKYIDRAGDALNDFDVFKRRQAIDVIADWRESHLFVLNAFVETLIPELKKNNIRYSFFAHRLKRMVSIKEKLRNNPSMGLGGMQDIGGMRIVFEDMDDLRTCQHFLQSFSTTHFIFQRQTDYISTPKESGYRSIHYIYKYKDSQDTEHDKLKIELQIRTRLQHSWAMAVETASLIAKTSLKANINNATQWRDFFKITSAVLAFKEKCPPHIDFKQDSELDLCHKYLPFVENHKMIDQLESLRVAVHDSSNHDAEYAILHINFDRKQVNIKYFNKEDEEKVTQEFTEIEKELQNNEALLLVATDEMQNLRQAYPSYFLDTEYFLTLMEDFYTSCKLLPQAGNISQK